MYLISFYLTPALSQGEKELRIDVSQLAAGVYYIQIGNEFENLLIVR
jgi:hypothetical protein